MHKTKTRRGLYSALCSIKIAFSSIFRQTSSISALLASPRNKVLAKHIPVNISALVISLRLMLCPDTTA